MLYYRRKSLGIAIDMNGIVTNSYQWHFTRITSSGQVGISFRLITDSADIEFLLWQLSQVAFDWRKPEEQQLIFNRIRDIVEQAFLLLKTTEPPQFWRDVSVITGFTVWQNKLESEALYRRT